MSLERITVTRAYIRGKSMPITHHMACKDPKASMFKFSDFPYLKDVTFFAQFLFYVAKYRLTPLLTKNPDPGRSLRKITLITSTNGESVEGTEQDYARELQDLILSGPYKSVQLEFRIMHAKINLVAETEEYVRQEFSRVFGEKDDPRFQLSITGKHRAEFSRLDVY